MASNFIVWDAAVRHQNHFAALGDSRMAQIFTDSPKLRTNGKHFWPQANARLGQRMKMVLNLAVSGQRSDQYMSQANIDAVIASDAKYCLIFGIVNDVGAGLPSGDPFINFIKPRVEQLIAAGITPILFTDPGATSFAGNAAARGYIQRYNAQLRNYMASRPNGQVFVFDLAGLVLDLTSTTIAFKPNYSGDGTHYRMPMAVPVGRAFAEFIRARIPQAATRKVNASEVGAQGIQIFANPGFMTATGGTAGTGITGTVPSGVSAVADTGITAVTSTAANADGTNDFIMAITATAAGRVRGVMNLSTSFWTTADVFDIYGQVEITANNGAGLSSALMLADAYDGTNTITSASLWSANDETYGIMPADTTGETLDHWFYSTIVNTLGFFSVTLNAYFEAAGTATLKWRHVAVDKRQAV